MDRVAAWFTGSHNGQAGSANKADEVGRAPGHEMAAKRKEISTLLDKEQEEREISMEKVDHGVGSEVVKEEAESEAEYAEGEEEEEEDEKDDDDEDHGVDEEEEEVDNYIAPILDGREVFLFLAVFCC